MRILFLLFFGLFCTSFIDPSSSSSILTVHISGIKENTGNIRLGVYKSADGFPVTGKQYKGFEFPVKNYKASIDIKGLPKGKYAIGVMHDKNANKRLDKNMLGLPLEPYGFSNDARGIFSAPSFESAAFYHDGSTSMTIKVY